MSAATLTARVHFRTLPVRVIKKRARMYPGGISVSSFSIRLIPHGVRLLPLVAGLGKNHKDQEDE
jgi:hypothetical protein